MVILRSTLLAVLLACSAHAVLNKEFQNYGPPPSSGLHREPHREYGVPQQIPFREYGPPSLKQGSSKLNYLIGVGQGGSGGLQEQIKSYFGVPKPFYGPPHLQHHPSASYGPPKLQFGPPAARPQAQYGPPPTQQQQHRPPQNYGPPPRPNYGPPPQALPLSQPGAIFKPPYHPASSYGPPPSGPLNQSPQNNYGPPPLPLSLPHTQQPGHSHGVPETTIIVTGVGPHHHHGAGFVAGAGGGLGSGSLKQLQIQIDSAGHSHSVSGSQAPFHTSCDGWKPIPTPGGVHVESNHIESQSGYSQVAQNAISQYRGGATSGVSGPSGPSASGGGSIVDGLTDEQLVAVALQAESLDGSNTLHLPAQPLPPTGPAGDFKQHTHTQNSIESDDLQLLGAIGDSYSRPPADSYAPGSPHAQQYNIITGGSGPNVHGLTPPNANYGPPLPPTAELVQHHQHHHSAGSAQFSSAAIRNGLQAGNQHSIPTRGGSQPSKPVSFRPPVPQGLLESIGATVQHFDQFGVKPQNQPPTYIPPPTNEFAQSGPGNLGPEYGAPQAAQGHIFEQQLPQPQTTQTFIQVNHQNSHSQQHQQNQFQQQQQHHHHQYQQQQRPPRPQSNQFLVLQQQHGPEATAPELREPSAPQQQYLAPPPPPPPSQGQLQIPTHLFVPPPPLQQQQQQQPNSGAYQHSASSSQSNYENSFSSSQHNEQFVHAQGLPVQQQDARFNQVHDCGHGPNLVGAGYQFQQQQQYQQQQQQQHQYAAASSASSYNAIAPSIPLAEQHTHFVTGPAENYEPSASGNAPDHIGYASQKNAVATLPDGTDPQQLPGLDGLNVISAQKSQSIQISPEEAAANQQQASGTRYQLQFNSETAGSQHLNGQQSANHEEILSDGLLQSILTAIEKPDTKDKQQQQQQQQHQYHHQQQQQQQHEEHQQQQQQQLIEPRHNYEAQSRSDISPNDDAIDEESNQVATKLHAVSDGEEVARVTELKAIVPEEVEADSKSSDEVSDQ